MEVINKIAKIMRKRCKSSSDMANVIVTWKMYPDPRGNKDVAPSPI